jgi:hypothetical protein
MKKLKTENFSICFVFIKGLKKKNNQNFAFIQFVQKIVLKNLKVEK